MLSNFFKFILNTIFLQSNLLLYKLDKTGAYILLLCIFLFYFDLLRLVFAFFICFHFFSGIKLILNDYIWNWQSKQYFEFLLFLISLKLFVIITII